MENTKVENLQEFELKIKNRNKKKIIFFFVRFLVAVIILVSFCSYLLTPISSIQNMRLTGAIFLNKDDIYQIINKKKKASVYSVNKDEAEELLFNYPLIDNATVSLNPFGIEVDIKEKAFAYQYNDKYYDIYNNLYELETINNNTLIQSYLSSHEISLNELPLTTSSLDDYNVSYLYNYLHISTLVNKEAKRIKYLEPDESKKSFKYYLKGNSNSNYLRVKLSYSDDFTLSDYAKCLIDENGYIDEYINKNYKESTLFNKVIDNGESISYYAFRITLSKKDGSLILSFEGDV